MKFLVVLILIASFMLLLFLLYQSQKLLRDVQRRHQAEKAKNTAQSIPHKARILHPKLKDVKRD